MDNWTLLLFLVVAVGLLMIFSGSRAKEQARISARLASVERKLDAVMAHLDIVEPVAAAHPEVLRLLGGGNKLEAIKVYREQTGASLLEAKQAVERLERTV